MLITTERINGSKNARNVATRYAAPLLFLTKPNKNPSETLLRSCRDIANANVSIVGTSLCEYGDILVKREEGSIIRIGRTIARKIASTGYTTATIYHDATYSNLDKPVAR